MPRKSADDTELPCAAVVDAFPAVLAVSGVSTDASSTERDRARDTGLERPARGIWYTGVLYLDRFGKLGAFADAAAIFGGACRGFQKKTGANLSPGGRRNRDTRS